MRFGLVLDEEGYTSEALFIKVGLEEAKPARSMSIDTNESLIKLSNST